MSLIERRYRGFRVINFAAFAVLLVVALGVYLGKTAAGREASQIKAIERQIASERREIRVLQAKVAGLERPDRIGELSTAHLGLAPVDSKHEVQADALPSLARSKSSIAAPTVAP